MKFVLSILIFVATLTTGCVYYQCHSSGHPYCEDYPPSGPTYCDIYQESWFFNPNTNHCQLVGYWDCYTYGFSNQYECEQCACH